MKQIKTYEDALKFIHGRTQFKKIPTLKRMRILMQQLGNPQDKLQMIHVTGTNGKGSTVAILRSLFMSQGQQVGTFTSPFLTRFNERISLNGEPIDDATLLKLTQSVAPVVARLDKTLAEGGPTEFEIVTALMFLYFKQTQPDIVIVEVGIGGMFDSTNIITPVVAVITTIGYDHMRLLGNTLPEIATQKAGIIKKNVPVVLGKLPPEARETIMAIANHQNAEVFQPDEEYTAIKVNLPQWGAQFKYSGLNISPTTFTVDLLGDYQIDNAAAALTTFLIYCQNNHIKPVVSAIKRALNQVHWAGRMERVNEQPLIILDGAHNLPAVTAIAQTIKEKFAQQEVYILIAILADKQVQQMIATLAALTNVHLIVTTFVGPTKKRPVANLAQVLSQQQPANQIEFADSWQDGLVQITRQMSAEDVLLITGSLYFISEVRPYFKD